MCDDSIEVNWLVTQERTLDCHVERLGDVPISPVQVLEKRVPRRLFGTTKGDTGGHRCEIHLGEFASFARTDFRTCLGTKRGLRSATRPRTEVGVDVPRPQK